ncbi:MAG TPA: hypothetical protein VEC38_10835 [Candidatus Binataceae bacterium]|nr:hypothetical protein [Candidatus Binataceae bacterium]
MNYLKKVLVSAGEFLRGQTMTEYTLVIVAVSAGGYVAYQSLEGGINTIVTSLANTLSAI